jgi:hypothetical protein
MRTTIRHCFAIFAVLLCQQAVHAEPGEREDYLHARDRIEWDAGGLYDGRFDDGTPFQIQLAYPRPAGVANHAADISTAYWYPRSFTGARTILAPVDAPAGTLKLVHRKPVRVVVETFSMTLAPDLRSGTGTWTGTAPGTQRAFSLSRAVLYKEVAVMRPAPPAEAGDTGEPSPFLFSALFPVLPDSDADDWIQDVLGSCGDSTECANAVMVDWYSSSLVSLDGTIWGYSRPAPHGNGTSSVRHYRVQGGKMAQLTLDDFLAPDAGCRGKVADAIEVKLRAQKIDGFNPANLDPRYSPKFLALPGGLEFHYDPYEVAGYAQGMPSVFLTRAEMAPCLRNLPVAD